MKKKTLYKYHIEVDLIVDYELRGFNEPLLRSDYPMINRNIVSIKEIEIIEK